MSTLEKGCFLAQDWLLLHSSAPPPPVVLHMCTEFLGLPYFRHPFLPQPSSVLDELLRISV